MKASNIHCKHCGQFIFSSEQIIKKVNLWDLGDYQAQCYMIREVEGFDRDLRRYDCSLHEGWYCCRFIMMRMTEDKFGTGENLLVYEDSVIEVQKGKEPPMPTPRHIGQIQLNNQEFEEIILASTSDKLQVVKLSGLWCPPCRLMDHLIAQIYKSGEFPGVEFFEIDIDEQQELAAKFPNTSIPYTLFFYKGKKIPIQSKHFHTLYGGIVGGIRKKPFEALLKKVLLHSK